MEILLTIFQNDIIVILRNEILQKTKGGNTLKIDDRKFDIVRANSGLTLDEIAKNAGVSRGRLNMILNSKRVTPLAAGKVARGLGCDVTDIID